MLILDFAFEFFITFWTNANFSPQAGDYVLVQLLLNRSEDSKQKLFAPGLIVKSPESTTDVTFIILLFTGERLIASRHDVIKVGK